MRERNLRRLCSFIPFAFFTFIAANFSICENNRDIWDVNGWKIKLHTPPSIKVIRAGRETKIDTLGYNMDERVMLNTELEIEFPKQVRVARIVPEEDERDDNKYKWFDLEKYCVELKEGEGLKKWFGWWIIFWLEGKEGTEGKEVPIYVRLKWKDKETGEKYDTGKRIINWIIVKGKAKSITLPSIERQALRAKIVILETSPNKVKFYIDANSPRGNPLEIKWKIDVEDWSPWTIKDVITKEGLSPGKHTVYVKVREKGKDEGIEVQREFIIPEDRPPIFEIYGPYRSYPDVVMFFLVGEDPEGDPFKYIYEIKGYEETKKGPISIVKLDLPSGTHKISVWAEDDKGKRSKIKDQEFTIENQGPIMKISKQGDMFILVGIDPESDIASRLVYEIYDVKQGENILSSEVEAPIAIVPIDQMRPGTYRISVHAEDDKGNLGPTVEKKFTVKNQGPKVVIEGPLNRYNGTVQFRLKAVDLEGDRIAGFRYQIVTAQGQLADKDWSEWSDNPIIITNLLPSGNHTIFVQAMDDKGNQGKIERRDFTIGKPASFYITRGEIAPWSKDIDDYYTIGWGYEVCMLSHWKPSFSAGFSFGFQKYDAEQKNESYLKIISLYAKGVYSLFKTTDRRFQLKSFLGLGPSIYYFTLPQLYNDNLYNKAVTLGGEMGLILEFVLTPPNSYNNLSFMLQGGINLTYHPVFQSAFTSLMLGVKYDL